MAMLLVVPSLLLPLYFTTVTSTSHETILSCSITPHPEVCTLSLNSYSQLSLDHVNRTSATSFRDLVLRAAVHRAATYTSQIANLGPLEDDPASAAWSDCRELARQTLTLLNRSISALASHSSTSDEDAQTWLSAAMANHQTCRDGFADLNLPLPPPVTSGNLSESISNSLAVNKAAGTSGGNRRRLLDSGADVGSFPEWLSVADRRLLQRPATGSKAGAADLVVAKDGSGDHETVAGALAAAAGLRGGGGASRFVIYVRAGVYEEHVEVTSSMRNVMVVGDGIDATVVTGSRSVQDGYTTFRSATFAVEGDGFIAQDITFENTAGPEKQQAVAFCSGSDLSVCYRCSFKGYQDTLYVHSQRQFYRDCDVYGTVDFVFGDATVVLQNCNLYVRKPMSGQMNTVTAQGRADPNENTGISIHNSVIAAAPDLKPVQGSFKSYLGRPWREYSRTVVLKTSLDSLIDPAGWLEWSGSFALDTLYYGEYMNMGPGSDTGGRVDWKGYHAITTASEAEKFTVGSFLSGGSWIPAGVPFTSGL